jgi:hypothetical protein
MRLNPLLVTITACLALVCGRASAQTVRQTAPCPTGPQAPGCLPAMPGLSTPLPGQEGAQPGQEGAQPGADAAQPPSTDAFAGGTPAGGSETGGFNPAMFGDLIGGPNVATTVHLPNGATVAALVPILARGSFKIADNESPRPTDRVFFSYNYFDRINTSFQGSGTPPFNLNREVIGFEKTFFNGNASFGLRMPFLSLSNNAFGNTDSNQVGDLSFIIKWALLNNRITGDVLSVGMVVTAPTGDPFIAVNGNSINPWLLQPYVGYIVNRGDFYLQGFTSLTVPTDSQDVTLLLNDIGVGYWVFRDPHGRVLKGLVPTFEAHLLTPLDHRGSQNAGGVPDYLSLTGGINAVFGRNSTLGFAVGAPVTGPRPYDMEVVASLNIRF